MLHKEIFQKYFKSDGLKNTCHHAGRQGRTIVLFLEEKLIEFRVHIFHRTTTFYKSERESSASDFHFLQLDHGSRRYSKLKAVQNIWDAFGEKFTSHAFLIVGSTGYSLRLLTEIWTAEEWIGSWFLASFADKRGNRRILLEITDSSRWTGLPFGIFIHRWRIFIARNRSSILKS